MMPQTDRLQAESAAPKRPLLQIQGLKKRFGQFEVLKSVDLQVEEGKVTFLIGPSGGGKSTLLRCMNFLERPSGGTIVFDGLTLCREEGRFTCAPESSLKKIRARMPMVFQHFNLFSHRTVLENVIEGPVFVQRRNRAEAISDAEDILRRVGLYDWRDRYPGQLSGGQKQRVAIARAVAMRPDIILFDEPTSALDPELVAGVLDTIKSLADEGRTMVVVTHEMTFARRLADTVHFVCDGVIAESGTPAQVFDAPKSERLKNFMGSILR
ncbi:MAG TPA: amino acid ABC transporter ATP-binding protein [Rhizobiaceae bacterium]